MLGGSDGGCEAVRDDDPEPVAGRDDGRTPRRRYGVARGRPGLGNHRPRGVSPEIGSVFAGQRGFGDMGDTADTLCGFG